MKYKADIIEVGANVKDMLQTGLVILFNKNAPDDLRSYCLITEDNQELGEVIEGDTLRIEDCYYTITAVGEKANENLYSLGHVSLCFDGAEKPQLPGHIHLTPEFKNDLTKVGSISIK